MATTFFETPIRRRQTGGIPTERRQVWAVGATADRCTGWISDLKSFNRIRQSMDSGRSINGRFYRRDECRNFPPRRGHSATHCSAVETPRGFGRLRRCSSGVADVGPLAQRICQAPRVIAAPVKRRGWIGHALTVATHFRLNRNIACVRVGRRPIQCFRRKGGKSLRRTPNSHEGVPITDW